MPPSPIDLCTLQQVRSWMPGVPAPDNTSTDTVIQAAITAASLDMLRRTGRGPRDWQVPATSPYNQPVTYTETYDGTGTPRMFLRNWPIISVSSLTVFGCNVQASTSQASPGYVIDGTAKSISLISPFSGPGNWSGSYYGTGRWPAFGLGILARFPVGVQNITITYTAGFNSLPVTELQTIPTLPSAWITATAYSNGSQVFDGIYIQTASLKGGVSSGISGASVPPFNQSPGGTVTDGQNIIWTNSGYPYTVNASVLPWLVDGGVTYFSSGNPFVAVNTQPIIGQYYIQAPGSYLFSSSDAEQKILMAYTAAGTPADMQLAVTKMVYLTYKRRGWEGLQSTLQKDVGETRYSSWEVDPSVLQVIENYRRRALTG